MDDNNWVYNIVMGDKKFFINLDFYLDCNPWMGITYLGNWFVIPSFRVEGILFFDGEKISVEGVGYHDHNIYSLFSPIYCKGYHFGKIKSGTDNITWARVIKRNGKTQNLVVLTKKDSFYSVNPENIVFDILEYKFDNGKKIPYVYSLDIKDNKFFLDMKIRTIELDYLSLPGVNYWRGHINNTGEIEINYRKHDVNQFEISEYLMFF